MFENFSKIIFKYSANQSFFSIIQMISIFKNLNIFNSKYFYSDSEKKVFCEIAIFFQHFQQCLYLFCESNLLNKMKTIFYDFVNTWFENQSNFIFLREFDIILTNAFFFICFQYDVQFRFSNICIRIFLWNFRKINKILFVCFAKATEIENDDIFIVFQFWFLRFVSRHRFFRFKSETQ